LEEVEKRGPDIFGRLMQILLRRTVEKKKRQRISFDFSSFYSNAANVKGKEKCWMGRFDISL
jgi:hypothetical protein